MSSCARVLGGARGTISLHSAGCTLFTRLPSKYSRTLQVRILCGIPTCTLCKYILHVRFGSARIVRMDGWTGGWMGCLWVCVFVHALVSFKNHVSRFSVRLGQTYAAILWWKEFSCFFFLLFFLSLFISGRLLFSISNAVYVGRSSNEWMMYDAFQFWIFCVDSSFHVADSRSWPIPFCQSHTLHIFITAIGSQLRTRVIFIRTHFEHIPYSYIILHIEKYESMFFNYWGFVATICSSAKAEKGVKQNFNWNLNPEK